MNKPEEEEYEEYEETENSTVSDDSEPSISDKSISAPSAPETPKPSWYQRAKSSAVKAAKIGYNSTVGEIRNGRVPVADTAWRTLYSKKLNNTGEDVFNKDEGYYKLGGKRTRKAKKSSSKKRKTVRRKAKKSTRKNRKH